jgi:pre-mRNA branch site protein p14
VNPVSPGKFTRKGKKKATKRNSSSLQLLEMTTRRANTRLPPEVNRILFVKNLPFKITSEELYDIFGKYGAIRQIRLGVAPDTKVSSDIYLKLINLFSKGTAFVIYEDIYDAKNAVDHLSGFNVCGRYLIVLYYQPNKVTKKAELKKKEEELQKLREKMGI